MPYVKRDDQGNISAIYADQDSGAAERMALEERLLERYQAGLAARGVVGYGLEDCRADYRLCVLANVPHALAWESLLSRVPHMPDRVHRIEVEAGAGQAAAGQAHTVPSNLDVIGLRAASLVSMGKSGCGFFMG